MLPNGLYTRKNKWSHQLVCDLFVTLSEGLKHPEDLEIVSKKIEKSVPEIETMLKESDFHEKMLKSEEYLQIYTEILRLQLYSAFGLR